MFVLLIAPKGRGILLWHKVAVGERPGLQDLIKSALRPQTLNTLAAVAILADCNRGFRHQREDSSGKAEG